MHRAAFSLVLSLLLGAAPAAMADGDAPPGAPAQPAAADVLTLKDGRRISGEIVAEDERFVSINSGGTTRAYARDTIASIEKAPRPQTGQEPAAGAPQPAAPAAEPPGKDKKRAKADRRDAPLSEAAKAWLDALIAKSADGDEAVRRSVAAAIGAMGPQAVPAVRAAATAAPEGPQKQLLTRLADDLESRRDRRMRGEPPMPGEGMGPDAPMPGAEPGAGAPGRRIVEGMMARLSTDLELRDDQKPKVEAVLQDLVKKRGELFRAARTEGLTAEQVAEKVTALRTDLLAQMKAVLDEPQYTRFQEMAARLVEPPRAPVPPRPADAGGAPPAPQPGGDQPK